MKLVQILLPVRDNRGRKFKGELYSDVHSVLVRRFGGLTAYTRSPARGLWKSEGSTKRDDMIIVEVMAKPLRSSLVEKISPGFRKQVPAG